MPLIITVIWGSTVVCQRFPLQQHRRALRQRPSAEGAGADQKAETEELCVVWVDRGSLLVGQKGFGIS